MKILSVNAGSSSLKFQLYEMPEEKVLISGIFERIGIDNSFYTIKINDNKIKKEVQLENHEVAFSILNKELLDNKIINSLDEIKGVGHRVVHGGDKYSKSVVIDNEVLDTIVELSALAPLHNPANIMGIKASMKEISSAIQVGCFDTAFHQTMEKNSYLYPIPYEFYEKYNIRKYGFHGMSHKYVSKRANKLLGKNDTKLIICHLGNGGSLSAVVNGKCIDTTMGFTPNAGIIMGSRSGDIDYSIIPYLINKTDLTIYEIDSILNKKSGLLGISGVSSDMRDVIDESEANNERANLAIDMVVKTIVGYISKYYVQLGGCDAICFTAGIGENSSQIRNFVINKLDVLGIKLDEAKNEEIRFGKEGIITTLNSSIPCYVIPTNEEVMIARDTLNLIN
ncbi:MAG: acetate kinase [Bacilli bacterium]